MLTFRPMYPNVSNISKCIPEKATDECSSLATDTFYMLLRKFVSLSVRLAVRVSVRVRVCLPD